jgi:hypothetical protein
MGKSSFGVPIPNEAIDDGVSALFATRDWPGLIHPMSGAGRVCAKPTLVSDALRPLMLSMSLKSTSALEPPLSKIVDCSAGPGRVEYREEAVLFERLVFSDVKLKASGKAWKPLERGVYAIGESF